MFAHRRDTIATLRLMSKVLSWVYVSCRVPYLLAGNMLRPAQKLTMRHRLINLGNLRARFNIALDIGSSGFSANRVCALPEKGRA